MTAAQELEYDAIIENAPDSFQEHKADAAYIKEQVDKIINEPDAQKAAQMAFNLVADMNEATVGQMACKALFDRDRALGKQEAPQLAAAVGNDILRAQLRGELPGSEVLELDAFARYSEGINGFNKQYHAEASPAFGQNLDQAVEQLIDKHNATDPVAVVDPEVSAAMAEDFISLNTAEHYSEPSMDYLASQRSIILNDQGHNERMIRATQNKHKPSKAGDDYVAPEPGPQLIQQERAKLADVWTNNNSALRTVNPALLANPRKNLTGLNKNWATALQVTQQAINKYGDDKLNFPQHQRDKQMVADIVFNDKNRQKVAAMHARADGRQNTVPDRNLVQGSKVENDVRKAQRLAMRQPQIQQAQEQPGQQAQEQPGQQAQEQPGQQAQEQPGQQAQEQPGQQAQEQPGQQAQEQPGQQAQEQPGQQVQQNPVVQDAEKKSRLGRVRDALYGAAKNVKGGINAKLDQGKLNQLQKQYDKRAAHGELLADRKQIADHIAGMSPEAKGRMMANLQAEYDPGKLLKGDREQRARQIQIAEQIDMCKMSPEALEALSDKLQQRVERNEPKMRAAERKRDAQQAKVDLRAARREQGQNQGHGARVG